MPSGKESISTPSRIDVVRACRILVAQGLDSGPFGNISIRIPGRADEFWQNPAGIHFDRLTEDDILRVDIHGRVLDGRHRPHPGEFIHREIYRLRPDVGAIVHTHSHSTVMLSLLGCEIEPFTQLGAALHGDQGIYSGFTGPVRDSNEGHAIAHALGDKSIVIAKNHGLFAAGPTIQAALWDMVVADWASRIHLDALKLGLRKAEPLSEAALAKSRREVRVLQCEAAWENLEKNAALL
jgi:L-ribulose-5-phosphate 4-epimerase